jgi:hypothetical protein
MAGTAHCELPKSNHTASAIAGEVRCGLKRFVGKPSAFGRSRRKLVSIKRPNPRNVKRIPTLAHRYEAMHFLPLMTTSHWYWRLYGVWLAQSVIRRGFLATSHNTQSSSSSNVLQVEPQRLDMGNRGIKLWLGANAGDLERFIPIGMAHQNPNSRHIALFLALDNHGIPHLFPARSADALSDRHRNAVCPRPEGAYRAGGAVNLKRASVLWFQYVWHASVLSL